MSSEVERDIVYAKLCQRVYSMAHLGHDFAWHVETFDGLQVLCFRGSKTWREWLADFVAFPLFPIRTAADLQLGLLHEGFSVAARRLLPELADLTAGGRFALVGHSLGGALATVLAGFLTVAGKPPREVVTFGSPRAGCDPLVTVLQGVPMRQYVYGNDIVPHVPSNPPFVHARQPLLHLGPPLNSIVSARLFSNHHIVNYIGALEAYAAQVQIAGPVRAAQPA